ncbi:MAG: hypothetical protein IPH39_18835 [Sulfuritalea sp.]|nr:hypothetical protein [Sulfuritalea sp.]
MNSAFELVPIGADESGGDWELAPIEAEKPSVLKTVALNNPLTAIAETGANLLSQGVALPAAGLAGIGAVAGRALGMTRADPAEVVHKVGGALTYQPRGEFGKAATAAVMAPFEALAKVGTAAGDKVLDATGSPVAATAVDTAINALPMAIAPAWKAGKATTAQGLLNHHPNPSPEVLQRLLRVSPDEAGMYFETWQAGRAARAGGENAATPSPVPERVQRVGSDEAALPESGEPVVATLRREGDQGLPALDGELSELPQRYGAEAAPEALAGAAGRERGLRADELPMDGAEIPGGQPSVLPQGELARRELEHRGDSAPGSDLPEHLQASPAAAGMDVEQALSRPMTRRGGQTPLSFNGRTQSLARWAREIGISPVTLQARLFRYGIELERALTATDLRRPPLRAPSAS